MEELRNSCARRSRADLARSWNSLRTHSEFRRLTALTRLRRRYINPAFVVKPKVETLSGNAECRSFSERVLFSGIDINVAWTDAKQHLTSALAHCSGTTVGCARIQEVGLRFSYGASTSGAANASDIAALSGQHLDIARACGARAGGAGPHDVSFQHFRFFLTGDGFAKLTADHLFQLPHQDS